MLEQSRTHTVVGAFGANGSAGGGITTGGVITALTNATPSVFTTTTAHGLAINDYVQVAGVTTDTSVNGNVQVSAVGSPTTFSIATAGIGTAGGLSASSASFAYPISSYTGDWTLRLRIESPHREQEHRNSPSRIRWTVSRGLTSLRQKHQRCDRHGRDARCDHAPQIRLPVVPVPVRPRRSCTRQRDCDRRDAATAVISSWFRGAKSSDSNGLSILRIDRLLFVDER